MVSKRLSYIWGIISGVFLLLVSLFTDEIRKLITSAFGVSSELFVFYALIALAVIGIVSSVVILIADLRKKLNVIIQEDSLRFNKYPHLLIYSNRRAQQMLNMVYGEVTIENCVNAKVKECEVEITLKKKGVDVYKSKVLSADSTKEPNPMTVSIDAKGTKGFHPLCLNLDSFVAFLPNHSLGIGGAFSGTLVPHGEYEIFGRVISNGKFGKLASLGKVNIPNDFVSKAKIPNDIQVTIDQGGFAVYVERNQDKVRAKFFGHNNDDDIREIFAQYLEKIPQIDDVIEDNGKLRSWRTISPISDISVVVTPSLVANPADREWREEKTSQLDPKFEHVYAVLFYPKEILWEKGERTPKRKMPRHKAIVNLKTNKAFWMLEYAIDLLNRGKIQFVTETWKGEKEFKKYFESKGFTLIPQPATETDLLEGAEERKP
jgi:hypothetical protein